MSGTCAGRHDDRHRDQNFRAAIARRRERRLAGLYDLLDLADRADAGDAVRPRTQAGPPRHAARPACGLRLHRAVALALGKDVSTLLSDAFSADTPLAVLRFATHRRRRIDRHRLAAPHAPAATARSVDPGARIAGVHRSGCLGRARHAGRLPDRRSPVQRSCTCSSAPPAVGSRWRRSQTRSTTWAWMRRPAERATRPARGRVGRRPTSDGRPLRVKIFGRDARGGSSCPQRGPHSVSKGQTLRAGPGWQQVEREALASVFAERASVPVLRCDRGVGHPGRRRRARPGCRWARRIGSLEADAIEDRAIEELWRAFAGLDAAGVALGRVTGNERVRSGGRLGGDRRLQRRDDGRRPRASCWRIGRNCSPSPRWPWGANGQCGSPRHDRQRVARTRAPLPAARGPGHRRLARGQGPRLGAGRAARRRRAGDGQRPEGARAASACDMGSIGKLALIGFVAYALISAVSNVGLSTIVDEFKRPTRRGYSPRCSSLRSPRSRRRSPRSGPAVPASIRPVADAAVRHPIHRARRPELSGSGGSGDPVLRAHRGAGRGRDDGRHDRQLQHFLHPDRC